MWRIIYVCCIFNLLCAASFPLSRKPHAGARTSRSGGSKSEGRQPFYHPYIKELYEKITYKNGSIITGNIGDDPVTIWSFLDTGEYFARLTVCMRLPTQSQLITSAV